MTDKDITIEKDGKTKKIETIEIDSKGTKAILVNLLTAGHVDDGKTTVAALLLKSALEFFPNDYNNQYTKVGIYTFDNHKQEIERGVTIDVTTKAFVIKTKYGLVLIQLSDCPGHKEFIGKAIGVISLQALVKNKIGCLLLISYPDGMKLQTTAHLYLLLSAVRKIPISIIYNKYDLYPGDIEAEKIKQTVEATFAVHERELPESIELRAAGALEETIKDHAEERKKFMEFLVKYVETIIEEDDDYDHTDENLIVVVTEVFKVPGRGMILAGTVLSGKISEGMKIDIVQPYSGQTVGLITKGQVGSIESFHKTVKEAGVGLNIGISVKGVEKGITLGKGAMIVTPGTGILGKILLVTLSTISSIMSEKAHFIRTGYKPVLCINGVDYPVTIYLLEKVLPGSNINNILPKYKDEILAFDPSKYKAPSFKSKSFLKGEYGTEVKVARDDEVWYAAFYLQGKIPSKKGINFTIKESEAVGNGIVEQVIEA